jgi:predicted nucleic acid-binding Zn ribbon protein
MSKQPLIHYEVEVLYETSYVTACGAPCTIRNSTKDDAQVTCPKCLAEMGYYPKPKEKVSA